MKKHPFRLFRVLGLLLLASLLLTGMGGKPDAPAKKDEPSAPAPASSEAPAVITSVNVRDSAVLSGEKPLVVTFSDAMAETANLDKPVPYEAMPFTLSPRVKGEGRWLTDKSFAFVTEDGFAPGKQYSLLFKDSLKSLSGRPVRYVLSFATERPKITSMEPGSFDAGKFVQELYLDFSMPVRLAALKEHLSVIDAESGDKLNVLIPDQSAEKRNLFLQVELEKYRPKLIITFRADKESDKYPLGFAEDHQLSLSIPAPGSDSGTPRIEAIASEPSPVKLDGAYSYEDEKGDLVARFSLSEYLATHSQKDFIEVKPDLPYSLNSYGDALIFREKLEPKMEITVTLKPGLTDSAGRALKEARSRTLTVDDREAAVRFAETGNFLTPVAGSRVALNVVNLDQVIVSLRRQYDNNLPFMTLDPDSRTTDMMRSLAVREIPLKGMTFNEVQRRALDLDDLAKGRRGVFMLTVRGYAKETDSQGQSYMAYANEQERLVALTDIGVTARVFPAGITVFASSISTAQGLPDAEVKVYSRSNQLIARGLTGPDGVLLLRRDAAWDPQLLPAIVTVQSGVEEQTDITFLPLNYETSIDQADPAMRDYLESGYEAFMYTPRGVFRPGEKVDIKAFVRDTAHNPPAPFPVLFRVMSSRGLEMAKGSVTLSAEGGGDFAFSLPASAPTGTYFARLEIPGQKNREIGSCTFAVEDFVPPRLEVSVNPKADRLLAGQTLDVLLSGQYLFGAPGAELQYELGYRARARAFEPEGWDGYAFGDAERKSGTSTNLQYLTGQLSDKGLAELDFSAPADWQAAALLHVQLIAGVREDGGRWVTQTGFFTYFPTPYLLGLKAQGENFRPGSPVNLDVAAVDPEGKAVDSGVLRAEISLIQGNWHTVYRNGRYVYTWDERFIPQERQTVESKAGAAKLAFTPQQYGRYLVRVSSDDGSVVASRRVSVLAGEGYGDAEGTGRTDKVELSFDRRAYFPGETARLSVKAPYAGTLLLGLEKAAQISTRVIPMEQPSIVVDIPVTENMDPNVSVTAWVIRPVRAENREWYAHRAHGLAALALSKEPYTLKVSALAPERATPSAPLTVPFTVTDDQGTPLEGEFSVALVDEGILSLTGYATPDPVDFFMALRRAKGKSHDAFDALLRPEAKATPLLRPGGGAPGSGYQSALSTQQVFLAAYLPAVRTDANGQGKAVFDLPEYSGKGRLMIVGASHDRFGSFAVPVPVARDIVVETSAPRAVAPGDAFDVFLKLFSPASSKLEGKANVRVSVEGPLAFSGDTEFSAFLSPAADGNAAAHAFVAAAKAGQASGIAKVTVQVAVPGRADLSFSKNFEVAVRPPYPRSSVVESALVKAGSSKTFTAPGQWLPGSVKAALTLDRSPVLSVLPALEFLREYPYGCLEQTVSRAWPFLTLASIQEALYPGVDKEAAANNTKATLAQAVTRILSMQLPDGGFGLWPGYTQTNAWVSVNAAFFLVEAKTSTPVPPEALERSLAYLRAVLASPASSPERQSHAYTTKAFAAFVLTRAGEAPLGWLQSLTEHESLMQPSGRLFLAGAKALKAGNSNALAALKDADFKLDRERLGYNESKESELRNQSLRLYLWTLVAPGDAFTEKLCLDVASRLGATKRYTTQEAGTASLALGAYLEKTGNKSAAGFSAKVAADSAVLASTDSGERLALGPDILPLDAKGAPAAVTVNVSGKGQAYCVYSVRGVPTSAPQPASSGIAVQRVWKNAAGEVIDLSSGTVSLKKGERVFVELTLSADRPLADIALSDLLPGGLEVENPRLSATGTAGVDEGNGSESAPGMYVDLREDRLLVFFDTIAKSPITYSYSMRAVSKGTFVLPPLAAEAMYAPEFNAITPSGTVVVE